MGIYVTAQSRLRNAECALPGKILPTVLYKIIS